MGDIKHSNLWIFWLALLLCSVHIFRLSAERQRIIVLTDGEIDDRCSMVHLLLCSSDVDIAAIVQTNSCFQRHGWSSVNWLDEELDHYAEVYPNLKVHDAHYPSPEELRQKVYVGDEDESHLIPRSEFNARLCMPGTSPKVDPALWPETPGSQAIVRILLEQDPRKVFIQAWGGGNTAAKAFQILHDQYPDDYERAVSKVVMYNIWYQDGAGNYIETYHPDVTMLVSFHFSGTWDYGSLDFTRGFVSDYMRGCKLACDYRQDYISEGDSPSFYYSLDNGLRSYEDPTWGSWGGRFYKVAGLKNVYRDVDRGSYQRWTEQVLRDFKMRLEWCNASEYAKANHHPKVTIANRENLSVHSGDTVMLHADIEDDGYIDVEYQWTHRKAIGAWKGTSREDFVTKLLAQPDKREVQWWQYHEAGTCPAYVDLIKSPDVTSIMFVAPKVDAPQTIHIVCEVTDNNKMGLTGYDRCVINVLP